MSDSTERLGELLVRMGLLTQDQAQEILQYQSEHPGLLFGQIAVRLGYVSNEKLNMYL